MIDSHCHINLLDNPQQAIDEAKAKGMAGIVISVTNPNEFGDAMALRNANKGFVHVCAGFHPHHVNDYEMMDVDEYIEQLRGDRFDIVGIGEIGLDYFGVTDEETKSKQKEIFKKFIEFAVEIEMPIVVHIREAFDDAMDALSKYKPMHVMLHCFSGSEGILRTALGRNYYISYATNVCYTKKHPRLAALTPLKNMLLETDAPWLDPDTPNLPEDKKGLSNRPWKIEKSAEIIAGLKKMHAGEVVKITAENARHVFRI